MPTTSSQPPKVPARRGTRTSPFDEADSEGNDSISSLPHSQSNLGRFGNDSLDSSLPAGRSKAYSIDTQPMPSTPRSNIISSYVGLFR